MSLQDRRLVRPTAHSPGTHATIVGRLPREVELMLSSGKVVESSGRIDVSSGLAIACMIEAEHVSSISIWEHRTCTLTEELERPDKCSTFRIEGALTEALVALSPFGSGSKDLTPAKSVMATTRKSTLRSATHRLPYFSLYACTTSGSMYFWNNALQTSWATASADPSDVMQLSLDDDEVVTSVTPLTPVSSGNSAGDVLASTDRGRLWIVASQGYPSQLQARALQPMSPSALHHLISSKAAKSDRRTSSGGYLTRLVGGIKETLYSSADPVSAARSSVKLSQRRIVNVSTLNSSASTQSSEGGSSVHATPLRPNQRARLHKHSPQYRSFMVLRDDLELSRWTLVSSEEDLLDTPLDPVFPIVSTLDEAVDLSPQVFTLLSAEWNQLANSFREYVSFVPLKGSVSKTMGSIGATFVFACRVSINSTPEQHRLYLVQCDTGTSKPLIAEEEVVISHGIQVLKVQWLSKYPSDVVPNLSCKGLVVLPEDTSSEDETGFGESKSKAEYMAYSTWELNPNSQIAGIAPVSASIVHFPSCTTFDMDMPQHIVPNALGSGVTSTSEGSMIMTATTGKVISLRAKLEINRNIMSSRQIAGMSSADIAPSSNGALLRMQSISASPGSPSKVYTSVSPEVQTLTRHLLSAFQQYYSQGSHAADASVAASLPPSLLEARSGALNVAVVQTSVLLCDEMVSTGSGGPMGIVKDKMTQHRALVNFVTHAGLYRKLTPARCKLMDHGEMLQACVALCELNGSLQEGARDRLGKHVMGLEGKCTHVWNHLKTFQESVFSYAKEHETEVGVSDKLRVLADEVSEAVCAALESSAVYRTRQREMLYDAPPLGSVDYLSPWTSSEEVRGLIKQQMKCIQGLGCTNTSIVRVLSRTWLQSFVEDDQIGKSVELEKEYEAAKQVCIPLLQKHTSNTEALKTSIEHGFFHGVVSICDQENDIKTLTKLMSSSSALHNKLDSQNRSFSEYVLWYFGSKEQFSSVMELGQYCPDVLQRFLDQDATLAEYRWIHAFRQANWAHGAKCLKTLIGNSTGEKNQLLDPVVVESLHKLATILAQE